MDAGLGGWAADHANGLTGSFPSAGVGLGALASNRQAAQMANAAITFDTLEPLEVHADFAPQVAFDDVLSVLDGVDDLRELLFGQVFGAGAGLNIGVGQDVFGIAGTNAVDIAQSDIDPFVGGNLDADDTCHKKWISW